MGIDELLDKNMEFASVIRSLRKNAREDAEQIAEAIAVADELASIAAAHLGWYLAHYPFTSTDLEQTRKITAAIQRWKKLKGGQQNEN